jgi:hypothetical protein
MFYFIFLLPSLSFSFLRFFKKEMRGYKAFNHDSTRPLEQQPERPSFQPGRVTAAKFYTSCLQNTTFPAAS